MLIIRLRRQGKSKEASFQLIISEKTKDTQGDYLERLGFYNPRTKEARFKGEKIKYWLGKGAQVSPTVNNLLIEKKIIEGKKIKKSKSAKKKESREEIKQAPAPPLSSPEIAAPPGEKSVKKEADKTGKNIASADAPTPPADGGAKKA